MKDAQGVPVVVDVIEKHKTGTVHKQIEMRNGLVFVRVKKRKQQGQQNEASDFYGV